MSESIPSGFWQRRLVEPIKTQLTQGVTPERLALTCALGFMLGVFPILGSTTVLCLLVGLVLKLNQPVIQALNYLVYPVQIALVPVFVRAGESLFGAKPVPLVPTQLVQEFSKGPTVFMEKYGMAGLYGMTAWSLAAPFVILGIYALCAPSFRRMKKAYGLKEPYENPKKI